MPIQDLDPGSAVDAFEVDRRLATFYVTPGIDCECLSTPCVRSGALLEFVL
jgi:hypothetical protein